MGDSDVGMLRTARTRYEQMYRAAGGVVTKGRVVGFLTEHTAPLLRGSYTDAIGRELFRAAGGLVAVAGICAYDSDAQGLAQRYFHHALRLAKASGDRAFGGTSLDKGDSQAADDARIALGRAQARLAELYRERGLLDSAVPASTTATPTERAAKGWESVLANPLPEFPPEPRKQDEDRKPKPKKAATASAPMPDDLERTLTYSTKRLAGVIRARKLSKRDEKDLTHLPASDLVFLPKGPEPLYTAAELEALGWSRPLIIELGSPTGGMRYRRSQILHRVGQGYFQDELARLYQTRLNTWHEQKRRRR